MVAGRDQQGGAIRFGSGDAIGGNHTASAHFVFDDHRSTSPLAEFGCDQASDQVGAAAGSGTADQPDRALRLGLRTGHDGRPQADESGGGNHQLASLMSGGLQWGMDPVLQWQSRHSTFLLVI